MQCHRGLRKGQGPFRLDAPESERWVVGRYREVS